jgi:hypothetical protein
VIAYAQFVIVLIRIGLSRAQLIVTCVTAYATLDKRYL